MHVSEYKKDPSKFFAYYKQFVTPNVRKLVAKEFANEIAKEAYPFRSIEADRWIELTPVIPDTLFRLCGDFPTLTAKIATLHCAAKMIKEGI